MLLQKEEGFLCGIEDTRIPSGEGEWAAPPFIRFTPREIDPWYLYVKGRDCPRTGKETLEKRQVVQLLGNQIRTLELVAITEVDCWTAFSGRALHVQRSGPSCSAVGPFMFSGQALHVQRSGSSCSAVRPSMFSGQALHVQRSGPSCSAVRSFMFPRILQLSFPSYQSTI
jgi:hypothetical protein